MKSKTLMILALTCQIVALMLAGLSTSAAGNLTGGNLCTPAETLCIYGYTGPITAEDVQKFSSALNPTVDQQTILNLSSPGGDINAALKIARIIQARRISTIVTDDNPCFSACVLLLASGVSRFPNENIGIHRIYSTTPNQTFEEKQRLFVKLEGEFKEILRNSGVSESLWDEMQRIPSEDVKILSRQSQERLGLRGDSPAYIDYIQNRQASNIGITRQELIARNAAINKKCRKPSTTEELAKWAACSNAILTRK